MVVILLHFFFFLSQLNFIISTDRNIFYPSKHIAEHLTCTVTDPTVLRPLQYQNVLTTEEQQIEASFISFKVSWLSLWKCSTHMQKLKTGRFAQLINDLKCCFSCRNSINNNRNSFNQQHTLQKNISLQSTFRDSHSSPIPYGKVARDSKLSSAVFISDTLPTSQGLLPLPSHTLTL